MQYIVRRNSSWIHMNMRIIILILATLAMTITGCSKSNSNNNIATTNPEDKATSNNIYFNAVLIKIPELKFENINKLEDLKIDTIEAVDKNQHLYLDRIFSPENQQGISTEKNEQYNIKEAYDLYAQSKFIDAKIIIEKLILSGSKDVLPLKAIMTSRGHGYKKDNAEAARLLDDAADYVNSKSLILAALVISLNEDKIQASLFGSLFKAASGSNNQENISFKKYPVLGQIVSEGIVKDNLFRLPIKFENFSEKNKAREYFGEFTAEYYELLNIVLNSKVDLPKKGEFEETSAFEARKQIFLQEQESREKEVNQYLNEISVAVLSRHSKNYKNIIKIKMNNLNYNADGGEFNAEVDSSLDGFSFPIKLKVPKDIAPIVKDELLQDSNINIYCELINNVLNVKYIELTTKSFYFGKKINIVTNVDMSRASNELYKARLLEKIKMESDKTQANIAAQAASEAEANEREKSAASLNAFYSSVQKGLLIFCGVLFIMGFLSIPFALYKRYKGEIIIIENITDAIFTLGSLVVAFIVVIIVANSSYSVIATYTAAALGFIFVTLHLYWMTVVARRSNPMHVKIWYIALARIYISVLPLIYLTKGPKTIEQRKQDESALAYELRVHRQSEENKQMEKDKTIYGLLILAITTLAIDKFAFEGVSSYFSRRSRFAVTKHS